MVYNIPMDVPPSDMRPRNSEEGVGPFFAIIIIVVLLAAGGIYFLVTREIQKQSIPPPTQEQAQA